MVRTVLIATLISCTPLLSGCPCRKATGTTFCVEDVPAPPPTAVLHPCDAGSECIKGSANPPSSDCVTFYDPSGNPLSKCEDNQCVYVLSGCPCYTGQLRDCNRKAECPSADSDCQTGVQYCVLTDDMGHSDWEQMVDSNNQMHDVCRAAGSCPVDGTPISCTPAEGCGSSGTTTFSCTQTNTCLPDAPYTMCGGTCCDGSQVCQQSQCVAVPVAPGCQGEGTRCVAGVGACAVQGENYCDNGNAKCGATAGNANDSFHSSPAPNGSWDWNCDGSIELQPVIGTPFLWSAPCGADDASTAERAHICEITTVGTSITFTLNFVCSDDAQPTLCGSEYGFLSCYDVPGLAGLVVGFFTDVRQCK
jgi:hypothetical protein